MPQDTQVLRPTVGVRTLCAGICIVGLLLLMFRLPDGYRVWVLPVYALLGVIWLADAFTRRIVLGRDSIRIFAIADFQSRTVPRAEVDSVTWEKGCGASIRLRDGKWVRLPYIGRDPQGLTNTIRASKGLRLCYKRRQENGSFRARNPICPSCELFDSRAQATSTRILRILSSI